MAIRSEVTDGEFLLAKFSKEDILARTLVSTKSKLKMLISCTLAYDLAKRKSN